jgi:hypothetical protein
MKHDEQAIYEERLSEIYRDSLYPDILQPDDYLVDSDYYEELSQVTERERQEDALDDAAQMEEDELKAEYYRGLEEN